MSFGILSNQPHAQVLGAYASIIPPECWSQAGFQDCHAKAYAEAQAECASSGLKDDTGCIDPAADNITMQKCACKRASATPAKTTTTPKKTVTSTSTAPDTLEPPEPMLLGIPMKTVAMIGLAGVAFYLFTQKKGPKS